MTTLQLSWGAAYLSQDSFGINQEQPSQRNPLLFNQHAIPSAEVVALIAQQRQWHVSQTAILFRRIVPRQQTVLGVCGGEDDRAAACTEVWECVSEGDDFRGTDKGPSHGDEAEEEPLVGGGEGGEGDFCGGRRDCQGGR